MRDLIIGDDLACQATSSTVYTVCLGSIIHSEDTKVLARLTSNSDGKQSIWN